MRHLSPRLSPNSGSLVSKPNIGTEVRHQGYAFLPRFMPGKDSRSAIGQLGQIEQVALYDPVHELVPRSARAMQKNTYSGTFGYKTFPLHSDFAHWYTPPRFLILRCVQGAKSVKTVVVDTFPLVEKLGEEELSRALVVARTPIAGKRPLLRFFDRERCVFRWDQLFLRPASQQGREMWNQIHSEIESARPVTFTLADPGDTLILDNWRCLHGRSAVSSRQRSRRILRAYLSQI
jgi:L-asparagine oxygenase